MGELEVAVHGDGVVHGGHDGPAVLHHPEQAPPEALVVVDDVEIIPALGQDLPRPQAECERLGKPGRAHQGELEDVDSTAHLAGTGDAKGVGLAVQVEAGDLHEGHAVVEVGVRGTGEDLDVMAEGGQLPGEIPGIHTLTPGMRVAPIGEERDPEPSGRPMHEGRASPAVGQ